MEYVYAALLIHSANKEVTEESITSVLEAAGVEANPVRAKALVAALEEIDIEEAISKGVAVAPTTVAAAPVAASEEAAATAEDTVEAEKKEEEKEKEEESGIEGLGALFG
ncbi:MAG: 50S ribosomal protein P1 [Methermicoccaceae archaeon]